MAGEHLRLKSTVQYNAPAALIRADLGRNRNQQGEVFDDYRVSVAGGIGLVGGTLAFGRPITGSFGVVKVADLSGVGVLLNGQPIGKTDSQGKAFIPTLSPYLDNRVSIAAETVPIDYSIKEVSRKTSPSLRSGVLIEFAVSKLQAVTGRLKAQHKEGFKSVEFEEIRLPSIEGQKRSGFQTGRGGEFYIENLGPGTYPATVMMEGKPCPFDLVVPQSAETFVELGDVVCRPSH